MSHAFYAQQINAIKTQIKIVEKELNHLATELCDAEELMYEAYITQQRLASIAANEDVLEARAPTFNVRKEGTKLVWTSDTNPETYCQAIVVKGSKIIQTKCVTDGGASVHVDHCGCAACWMYAHDPQERRPLTVTFFDDEYAWRQTLDMMNGSIYAYDPPPQLNAEDALLKKLSCDPLLSVTDGEKLKELEKRFPGGIFVLTTATEMLEIKTHNYSYAGIYYTLIMSTKTQNSNLSFKEFEQGAQLIGAYKPNLMVEWMGLYIGLEHLF